MTEREKEIMQEYKRANELIEVLGDNYDKLNDTSVEDWFIALGRIDDEDIFNFTKDLEDYLRESGLID